MIKKSETIQWTTEKLIADIARRFVMVDNVSDAINEALKKIGLFSNASRAYIFEFGQDKVNMNNTFEWCDDGVSAEIGNLQDLPISLFPWWIKQLKSGDILDIREVASLGEEAQAEKDILQSQGILSVLVLPLLIKGELFGFVGFDNTRTLGQWTEEDKSILGLTSELFSSAFTRMLYELQLKKSNLDLHNTLEELKETQSQLISKEQMAAIGQLAAGVAHEINNPLTFIKSNNESIKKYILYMKRVMEDEDVLIKQIYNTPNIETLKIAIDQFRDNLNDKKLAIINEELVDMIDDIDLGLDRVSRIVEGLRYFSHTNKDGNTESYNLLEGVENTLIMAENKLNKSITIIKDFPNEIPVLNCMGNEINQVLLNTITNAIEALESITQRDKTITIKVGYSKDLLSCSIEDNGCGMDPMTAEKVFQPFFTTKRVGQATGLGMSIAYNLMKKNRGDLKLETTVDKGTKVTLVFDLIEDSK